MSAIAIKGLKDVLVALDKMPFRMRKVTAMAIRNTGLAVVDDTTKRLIGQKFIQRKKNNKYGFTTYPRFVDPRKLTLTVGSVLDFWPIQEKGGVKRPRRKALAIPLEGVRPTPERKIPKSKRPRALFQKDGKRKPFTIQTNRGPVIFQRTSKRKIKPMYALEKDAKVRKRFGYKENAQQVVDKKFQSRFNKAFLKEFYRF